MEESPVRLTVLALRACSYKTKAEAWQQGFAHILFKGWMSVFVNRNDKTKGLFPVYRLEEDGDLWKKVLSGFRFGVKSLLL